MNSDRTKHESHCPDPEEFEPLVNAYASGPLAPEDERRAIRHLRECASCRREYEEAWKFFTWFYTVCPPKVTDEQVERIKQGVMRRIAADRRRRKFIVCCGLAAAVALVVWAATSLMPGPSPTTGGATKGRAAAEDGQEPDTQEKAQPIVSKRLAGLETSSGQQAAEGVLPDVHSETGRGTPMSHPETPVSSGHHNGPTPAQVYGRIWQESVGTVYSPAALDPGQKEALAKRALGLNALLDKDLDSAPAWNHLVRMYEKLGDLEASDTAFEGYLKALSKEESKVGVVEALVDRGNRLLRLGAGFQAVKHYSRVISDYGDAPGSERAWYGIGNYYLQVGDPARARKYLEHVCGAYEFNHGVVRDAHYTLANVSSNCGDYEGAIKTMERLLEKPCEVGSRAYGELRIGDFYRYAGKTAKAIQVYRKVLKEYPAVACVTIQARNILNRMQAAALDNVIP
jgi:tetratricopeptide (TPR) repeat protein